MSAFVRVFTIAIICLTFSFQVMAFTVDDNILPDDLESRAVKIFKVTRCMICSGESLYESQSTFAYEMRAFIRQKILEGASNEDIIDILKSRYGNNVLYYTPGDKEGLFLLFIPVLFAMVVAFCILLKLISTKRDDANC